MKWLLMEVNYITGDYDVILECETFDEADRYIDFSVENFSNTPDDFKIVISKEVLQ